MKCMLIVLVLVLVHLASSTLQEQWLEFKAKHNKEYSHSREESKRFKIFSDNLDKIEAHNAKYRAGEKSFYMGMNKFGDLTASEFLKFVNSSNSNAPVVPKEKLKPYVRNMEPLAADVDWRTQNVLSPVSDQGSCGASWAFSAVGAVESQLAIRNGRVTPLSAQNIVSCAGSSGCTESTPAAALEYIQASGVNSEADYPYTGSAGSCSQSSSTTSISGFTTLGANEGDLQNAVGSIGPIAASIHATDYLQFYYGGILYDDTCWVNSDSDFNHSVLVVGYGTERLYDYWIAKNSWGADWGENGYYKSIRNYGNNCGLATRILYPQV